MMVSTSYGRVYVGVCKPRKVTTAEGLAWEIRGEVAAMCRSSVESGISLMMCCPSGVWPGQEDLDLMISDVLERACIRGTRREVKEAPPEYLDKDIFRFFKSA